MATISMAGHGFGPISPTPSRSSSKNFSTPKQKDAKQFENLTNSLENYMNTPTDCIHHSPRRLPISPLTTPKKSGRQQYADRFIPNRNSVNFQTVFSLANDPFVKDSSQSKNHTSNKQKQSSKGSADTDEADLTFAKLLKTEMFGSTALSPKVYGSQGKSPKSKQPYTSTAPSTPNENACRYKSPNREKSHISSPPVTPTKSSDSSSFFPSIPTPDTTPRQSEDFSLKVPLRKPLDVSTYHDITRHSLNPNNAMYSVSRMRPESQRILLQNSMKKALKIPTDPVKVLDAQGLVDDYYLNLLDWGAQNLLAVGLESTVYLWHSKTYDVFTLCNLELGDSVTSVSWIKRGTHLAVGTDKGLVQIWDAERCKRVRTMTGHDQRTSSLAWNDHILSSGSKDKSILHHDVRIPEHYVTRLTGHKQEVCGLKWNSEENQLASGGNDNKLLIWEGFNESPLYKFTDHTSAVKALAWSPHSRGLLASGGGTADRRIRFWDTLTGSLVNEIVTESQVCNLAWSQNSNKLVSTHGFSNNLVSVWNYPNLKQIASLSGHTSRVLYLALSPDGSTIVTGAGMNDATLRFWKIFESNKRRKNFFSLHDSITQIR